ncbi:uncharacterized protein LOC101735880 [Bombyx mori]|uniref:Uncharacterized protein n=1 Tax=Bombyx mori TaxID=7091 RepID=A0A8R2C6F4_BOMMO|nr:uncharacterized protein LOC101735880 [Bombyx mori]XP_037876607.1 uncharacterized protein LOC101735880 [Bombyx mori]XP_037876608.1 uncharacterized protein LOC101735880 [Bombyx mori]
MAKFLKSFFTPSEKRKHSKHDGETEDGKTDFPPLDERRKLSISRSGRLKQANRKRHSLSLDLYGESNQCIEKPKSREYHVQIASSDLITDKNQRRKSADSNNYIHTKTERFHKTKTQDNKQSNVNDAGVCPETEIDSAFEIIDRP